MMFPRKKEKLQHDFSRLLAKSEFEKSRSLLAKNQSKEDLGKLNLKSMWAFGATCCQQKPRVEYGKVPDDIIHSQRLY